MRETWQHYFKKERQLRILAERAGLANPTRVAAHLNERLRHGLSSPADVETAKLLILAAKGIVAEQDGTVAHDIDVATYRDIPQVLQPESDNPQDEIDFAYILDRIQDAKKPPRVYRYAFNKPDGSLCCGSDDPAEHGFCEHCQPRLQARLANESRAATTHQEADMSLLKRYQAKMAAGKRNSAEDQQLIDATHHSIVKARVALGKNAPPTVEAHLDDAHDTSVGAGAQCDCKNGEIPTDLSPYEAPDPYAPRALSTAMLSEERESLGAYADDIAKMRAS